MILSPQPKLHFTDQNGKPLAGGTLSTYTGSSTNPVQTYADYAGTVLNPVHITLDARGECQVFLNPSIVYIFVLKDKNGTEIYTVNGVTASGSGSSGSNISITSTDSSVTITSTVATDGSIVYNLSIQNQIDTINTAITSEANTRANADSTLQTNLNNEITSRWQADSNLQDQIDNIGSYTASAPITITDKVITHDPSGVQPGSYGDTSDSRVLAWGDSFKVNTNTIDKYGHVTSATETNLTLPTVEKLENNYFLGSYADATTFSTSPIVIPFTKIDGKNITYSDGLIVTSNIELFDLSFNLYGNFQDYETATDSRLISIGLYKDSVLYDVKIFNVNAFDNKIEINGNFKVKNTGSTYLIEASTDVGTFVLSNSTSSTNLRVNDETANPSINSSGSSEVYHTSSFTGNGNIDNPLTLVPASTTLLGGIKVGSNLSISSDGTLNATGGGGLSVVVHDATLTGDGTAASPLSVVGGGGDSRGIPPTMDSEGYYHIYTLAQMLWVNNNLANLPEKNYKLMNDIVCNSDYSDYLSWETTPPMNEMLAAGGCIQANYFDGNGHTIYGMYSYNTIGNDAAFFGTWASGTRPTIKNVRLKNCTAIGNTTAEAIITNGTYSNICVESCLFKNLSMKDWKGSSIIENPSYYGASIVSNVYSINCTLKGGNAYDHASLFIGQVAGEGNSATSEFFNCYENQTESIVDSFAGSFAYPVNGINLYKQSGASWNVGGTFNLTDCAEKGAAEMKSQAFCDLLNSNASASSYPATWSYSNGMFPYLFNWTQD